MDATPRDYSVPTMRFFAFQREFRLSVNSLGVRLGFYDWHEMQIEDYRRLPTDFPSDQDKRAIWETLMGPGISFQPGAVSSTLF